MTNALLVSFLLATAVGAWVAYQLFLQNGRLLVRINKLEELVGVEAAASSGRSGDGVILGGMLMDFALPALSGETVTLSQWRGRRLLLVFFNPRCPFCMKMLPDLLAIRPGTVGSASAPAVLVVTRGSVEENRRLFAERASHLAVAVQEDGEVASVYGVYGTPMGCLVDEDGRASSELTAGADALLALARSAGLRDGQRRDSARPQGAGCGSPSRSREVSSFGMASRQGRARPTSLCRESTAPSFHCRIFAAAASCSPSRTRTAARATRWRRSSRSSIDALVPATRRSW
jgi:peroxiredoxin